MLNKMYRYWQIGHYLMLLSTQRVSSLARPGSTEVDETRLSAKKRPQMGSFSAVVEPGFGPE